MMKIQFCGLILDIVKNGIEQSLTQRNGLIKKGEYLLFQIELFTNFCNIRSTEQRKLKIFYFF